ncbi:MAG TPA: hypothetical protein DCQ83_00455 [Fibrobacteres bacterium]|nr:hypothetical protein [Fibrobacterota bacterium]
MKHVKALAVLFLLSGCFFQTEYQYTGGEDFPNTIQPVAKVAATDISSYTQWDQFQGIDTTPDLSVNSLAITVSTTAKIAAGLSSAVQDTILTLEQGPEDWKFVQKLRVNSGDGSLSTKSDNRIREYIAYRVWRSDTLEWTRMIDADGDSVLWGSGDSGVVELQRKMWNPLRKPDVEKQWSVIRAKIYHRGKTSQPLSYSETDLRRNGDTALFTAKGVRGDSSLVMSDTSLVTFVLNPLTTDSLQKSTGRYWVRLGKLAWPFRDNALLRFNSENRWKSGVLRYSSLDFTPDTPMVSGSVDIHGNFVLSTEDEKGATGQVTGTFRGDTLDADMHEHRDGKDSHYHMVCDKHGDVKQQERRDDAPRDY